MAFRNHKAQFFLMAAAIQCIAVRAFSRTSGRVLSNPNVQKMVANRMTVNRLLTSSTGASTITQLNGVKSTDQTLDELDAALESILSGVSASADIAEAPAKRGKGHTVPSQFVEKVGLC